MISDATFITASSVGDHETASSQKPQGYMGIGPRAWICLDVSGKEEGEYCQSLIPFWIWLGRVGGVEGTA